MNKFPGTNFHDLNLDWVINQVKTLTTEWLATQAAWTATQGEWQQLYNFVVNYFANLNVSTEINAKLDQMASDGTLLAVIRDTVEAQTIESTTAWLADHITQETGYVVDDTLSVEGAAADAKATGDAIDGLRSESVLIAGENQVTPQNIQGMKFTKTPRSVEGPDLFDQAELFMDGRYVVIADGKIGSGANAAYKSYCIPVDGVSTYTFTQCNFVSLALGNEAGATAVGTTQSNIAQITTTGAAYLFLSYNMNSTTDIEIHKPGTVYDYSDFISPDWLTGYQTPYKMIRGDLAANGRLYDANCREEMRKNDRIIFIGTFASFTSVTVGNRYMAQANRNFFVVDTDNISYYEKESSTPVVVAHGLTIANNICVFIEQTETSSAKVTVISNGVSFKHLFSTYVRGPGAPMATSAGAMTDCVLSWINTDIHLPIWILGDSYVSYNPQRWTYYLHEYGYDRNALISGWPGEASGNVMIAFVNCLKFGHPRFACMFSGMNDDADSESTPAANWASARDTFLTACAANNVTPVFGTIPSSTTKDHTQKNAWIRSSGYRYVDFEAAVGAQSDGTWYTGMQAQDGTHPTENGARALFAQFMADMPEIMLGATWGCTPVE